MVESAFTRGSAFFFKQVNVTVGRSSALGAFSCGRVGGALSSRLAAPLRQLKFRGGRLRVLRPR